MNQSGTSDISTAFLAYPEKTREAIQLAVRLYKKRAMGLPQQEGAMRRGGGGDMHERLQRLAKLVQTGVLTGEVTEISFFSVSLFIFCVMLLAAKQDLAQGLPWTRQFEFRNLSALCYGGLRRRSFMLRCWWRSRT